MAIHSKGKKRGTASREAAAAAAQEEKAAAAFPKSKGIDVPSDPEHSSDDDEDVEEGDFEEMLKKMADDQGIDSEDAEDYLAGDSLDEEEGDEEDESDIHSSDIEGASSEDGDDGSGSESDNESGDESEADDSILERITSRSSDGQHTAVDSQDEEASEEELGEVSMDKLTIRDFGRDIQGWKEYRKTLPQIDAGYASDSSTEEPENTIGSVPIEWYEDYPHIGYDIDGKRIMKPATADELDKFLANMDDPDVFRTARDEVNQQDVKLSEEEI
ncbi:Ribosome biogenesis protein erb1, partial [Coemansia sp. RSA 2320]